MQRCFWVYTLRLNNLHGVRHRSSIQSRPRNYAIRKIVGNNPSHATRQKEQDSRAAFLDSHEFGRWLDNYLTLQADTTDDKPFANFLKSLSRSLRQTSSKASLRRRERIDPASALDAKETRKHVKALESAYLQDGQSAVNAHLHFAFHGHATNQKLSKVALKEQKELADLRYPVEWYPGTRAVQRTIYLHVGPTNSGKTYHALQRLETAKTGVYAGPLRLLAHEVYGRLNAKGKACSLVTGDEQIINPNAYPENNMMSCTVEMIPLNQTFDVAVIDEIQMIGDDHRGWAWTQALLGLRAKELHICGEERTVPLIRDLVGSMGDELKIRTYKRLTPLKTMSTSMKGSLKELKKGDCVVVFSRVGIHAMKQDIEKSTQRRVAIVYGSLPPEIRAQQARLFNDPNSDYDILVASDAIGMGLNLAIKRIIFESVNKFNGFQNITLEPAQIKQIAGRAGRFRTAAEGDNEVPSDLLLEKATQNVGLVTTLEEAHLPIVRRAMRSDLEPIMCAGIFPPVHVLVDFAAYFPPGTKFSYILTRLNELSCVNHRYKICLLKDQIAIADLIEPVKNLSTQERIIFCASPAPSREQALKKIVQAFASCVGDRTSGALLDIKDLPIEILDSKPEADAGYLHRMELLHKALVLYLWLSYRLPGVFVSQDMAFYVKSLVEERIEKTLTEYSASKEIRAKIRRMRKMALEHSNKVNEADKESPEQGAVKADEAELLISDTDVSESSKQQPEPKSSEKLAHVDPVPPEAQTAVPNCV